MDGTLEKLIIKSFDSSEGDNDSGTYTAEINPDQIVFDSKIEYNSTEANSTAQKTFKCFSSPKLSLKLLFDGTGIVKTSAKPFESGLNLLASVSGIDDTELSEVNKQIKKFKDVVDMYHGQEHEPHKVKVVWGEFLFEGRLESLKITYTLFKPDGSPLRATGDAVFVGSIHVKTQKEIDNDRSPDLTHVRTVMQGDTLPLMCDKIYKDSKHYLEIARVNGLSNYRKLEVGSKLFFPPIKDTI